jgi:hypothetical protein
MNIIWITQSYLKSLTPINNNVDVTEVSSHIETAQLIYTRELLGKLLYDDLDTKIKSNTLSTIETELVDIIKQSIAYRSAEIALPFLSFKIRNKGAVKLRDEFADPVSLDEMKYLKNELSNRAEYFEKRVQDFLCEYSTDFPLWLKSKDANGNKQQIYPNMNNPYDSDIYLEDKEYWDRKRNRYYYGPNGSNPTGGY